MTAPVSCVITSYNNGRTLRGTVESVLRQTLPVAEIVLADDGSTDGSREMIAFLAREHACITPILRETNLGVAANRDLALRAASQPFVTHLDGDDLFASGKIAAEWRALGGRIDAVAYSMIAQIWPGQWWRWRVLNPAETVGGAADTIFDRMLVRAGSIPRDMLMSKALFERAGGFSHDVQLYEDWQFKLRLARTGAAWVGSKALGTIYLQHPGTLSRVNAERHRHWKGRVARSAMAVGSTEHTEIQFGGTGLRKSRLGARLQSRLRLLTSLDDVLPCLRLMAIT